MNEIAFMEDRANWKWNATHPVGWPVPPRTMPSWMNLIGRYKLRDMEEAFGHLDQTALDRFWSERAKGQSVYEDAGGYLVRCYAAMAGHEVEEPYTYSKAVDDLMQGVTPQPWSAGDGGQRDD